MNKAASSADGDFTSLLRAVRECRMSVEDFLRLIEFEKWLAIFCHRYDFKVFEGTYEPKDLQQQAGQKVVQAVPGLDPENTPNKATFYGWLRKVIQNTYFDELRRQGKALRSGWVRSDEPMEWVSVPSPADEFDGRDFLSRFLRFIRNFPPEHQFAIVLWLMEDRSYREIQKALHDEGVNVSHVTVGNWITAALNCFRESLERPRPGGGRPPR